MLLARYGSNRSYAKQLPPLPDLKTLSLPLQEQISEASLIADRHPTSANLGNLGMIYNSSAFYDQAAVCYKLAIKRRPSSWKWNYYLGYLNREMSNSEAALENFREVVRKNPKLTLAWYYVGEEYQNMGNYRQAEIAFNKIISEKAIPAAPNTSMRADYFPLSVYAKYELARILIENKQADAAKRNLQEILKNYRTFGQAYRLLGTVFNSEGDSVQGNHYTVMANDLAVDLLPVDTIIDRLSLLSRSDLYLLKKIDEAEKSNYPDWAMKLMTHGFKYIPDNKYLISKFIKLYLKLDIGNQASPLLEKHKLLFSNDYNELSSMAYLLYLKGLPAQSLAYYRLARQIRPDVISVQTSIILCLWNVGNKKQALDSTLSWLGSNPSSSPVLKEGVRLLVNLKEVSLAKMYLNKLKKISAQDAEVMSLTGKVAEAEGNLPEAEKWYETAFRNKPDDLANVRSFINLLLKQELWAKSITTLRKALVYHPNDPFLLERLGTLLVTCPDTGLRNMSRGKGIF